MRSLWGCWTAGARLHPALLQGLAQPGAAGRRSCHARQHGSVFRHGRRRLVGVKQVGPCRARWQ